MGQKVSPYIVRVGFGKNWQSLWFALRKREYADFLEEDVKIRKFIRNNYQLGSIASIGIERVSSALIRIKIRTSRPGVIIGRRGQDIERVKAHLGSLSKREVIIDVEEVIDPNLDAQLIAEQIAFQIVKRVNFKRAMKKAIQQAMALGCEGMRVKCSGRLGGAEIARNEIVKYGKIPLQTFRADIDYGFAVARTTYGAIGIKTWVYKGEKPLGTYMIKQESQKDSAPNNEKNKGQ
jgi:small subunit ribosomal protein S3